jgi:multidrug/hemolysin transport system permease protein
LAAGRPHLSLGQLGQTLGAIVLGSVVFAAFNTLCVTFLKSLGAFSGYSLVLGVGMGFLSYCYVTPGMVSEGLRNVFGLLPFAQAGAMIRAPMVEASIDRLLESTAEGAVGPEARATVLDSLAAELSVNGHVLSAGSMTASLVAMSALLTVCGCLHMRRVIR